MMITVSALAALNENRLDFYLSIFTLIYLVTNLTFRPRKRTFDFIALFLLLIFVYITITKILEILILT